MKQNKKEHEKQRNTWKREQEKHQLMCDNEFLKRECITVMSVRSIFSYYFYYSQSIIFNVLRNLARKSTLFIHFKSSVNNCVNHFND